jgi:threonine dehydrogenase-like Zn-dependent dehydrogenase
LFEKCAAGDGRQGWPDPAMSASLNVQAEQFTCYHPDREYSNLFATSTLAYALVAHRCQDESERRSIVTAAGCCGASAK